uniref:Uncharacterized protein n=1 Tax=Glossina pallidipes TaxID=7398 RepID=A0A1A9ZZY3_GLOPL
MKFVKVVVMYVLGIHIHKALRGTGFLIGLDRFHLTTNDDLLKIEKGKKFEVLSKFGHLCNPMLNHILKCYRNTRCICLQCAEEKRIVVQPRTPSAKLVITAPQNEINCSSYQLIGNILFSLILLSTIYAKLQSFFVNAVKWQLIGEGDR